MEANLKGKKTINIKKPHLNMSLKRIKAEEGHKRLGEPVLHSCIASLKKSCGYAQPTPRENKWPSATRIGVMVIKEIRKSQKKRCRLFFSACILAFSNKNKERSPRSCDNTLGRWKGTTNGDRIALIQSYFFRTSFGEAHVIVPSAKFFFFFFFLLLLLYCFVLAED